MKLELTSNGKLRLEFPYSKDRVDAIKQLYNRKYNPTDKSWTIGFDESNLQDIFDTLAKYFSFSVDRLNEVEAEAKLFLSKNPVPPGQPIDNPEITQTDFQQKITPMLLLVADLTFEAYMSGRINQDQQGRIIAIINHLNLRDMLSFCRYCRDKHN